MIDLSVPAYDLPAPNPATNPVDALVLSIKSLWCDKTLTPLMPSSSCSVTNQFNAFDFINIVVDFLLISLTKQVFTKPYNLTWFRADKKVEGQPVVQFERLVGEVTSLVDATYLKVPRTGSASRFLPVKTPENLTEMLPLIKDVLGFKVTQV